MQAAETLTTSSHVELTSAAQVRVLKEPERTSCRFRRAVPQALERALNEVATGAVFHSVVRLPWDATYRDAQPLLGHITAPALRTFLADDVAALARSFCSTLDARMCSARLEVVTRDACRRFHHDFVSLRLLCTYAGPGTEWLEASNVDATALGALGGDPEQANQRIVRDRSRVLRAEAMDVLWLKGASYPGHSGIGAVHRSPSAASLGTPRLVLKLDALEHSHAG